MSVLGAGKHQMPFVTLSAILGGNVRVGLEDNLFLGRGKLAKSNAEQVVKIRRILEELGHRHRHAGGSARHARDQGRRERRLLILARTPSKTKARHEEEALFRRSHMPASGIGAALVAIAAPGSALAGALEQVVPATIRLLYEEGRYVELGATYIDPEQSGEGVNVPPNTAGVPPASVPGNTGQIFDSDWSYSGAYKADLNDRFSYLLAFRPALCRPHDITEREAFRFRSIRAPSADMETWQVTAALSYDVTPNVKIYGGVRAQRFDATVNVSFPTYSVESDKEWGWGYLVGAAYERPEIALRVALTYYSDISYDLATDETVTPPAGRPPSPAHDHGRRDAAVGPARLPDRRRSEDPRLRLCPLGRLDRVQRHPAAVR